MRHLTSLGKIGIKSMDSPSPDARAMAQRQFDYYKTQARRAKISNDTVRALLLVVTASITLSAALELWSWVTAVLGAFSFLLAGLQDHFNFQETWVRSGEASVKVLEAMEDYDILPEDRKDQAAKELLLARVQRIREAEARDWAGRYKEMDKKSEPSAS